MSSVCVVRAQKRNVADDHVNVSQNSKNKAMDALKVMIIGMLKILIFIRFSK